MPETICIVDEVEARLASALAEWDAGRATSPDSLDYVIYADEVLRARDPGYSAPTFDPMPFEVIADEMFNAASSGYLPEVRAFAIYAVARLYGFDAPAVPDDDALDALAELIDSRSPERAKSRMILVHLNVRVPDEIADALLAALEVGSDDDQVRGLQVICPMAEAI